MKVLKTIKMPLAKIMMLVGIESLLVSTYTSLHAQPWYKLTKCSIQFFAGTPVEDIDAVATKAVSFFNIETGVFAFSVQNKDFKFKRKLMEEHFNENYMETHKYPQSEFKGKMEWLENPPNLSLNTSQTYDAIGIMQIHGVEKNRIIPVKITPKNGQLLIQSEFEIALDDYKIDRPKLLWEKLAEKVRVTLEAEFQPYKP